MDARSLVGVALELVDGFDTEGCWVEDPPGTFTRTCLNGGGYNQNIYGNSITIP